MSKLIVCLLLMCNVQSITTEQVFERYGGENELSQKILDSHNLVSITHEESEESILFCIDEGCKEYVILK